MPLVLRAVAKEVSQQEVDRCKCSRHNDTQGVCLAVVVHPLLARQSSVWEVELSRSV